MTREPRRRPPAARLNRWLDCRRCGLAKFRRHVVLGRGGIPADMLLIGEAPGKSEDFMGEAFVGPSGRLLKQAMYDAGIQSGALSPLRAAFGPGNLDHNLPLTYYITNIVACRPCDEVSGPNREPEPDEIAACAPRLAETVNLVAPDVVVFLGQVAAREAKGICPEGRAVVHPAYVLRQGGKGSPHYTQLVRDLAAAFKEAM